MAVREGSSEPDDNEQAAPQQKSVVNAQDRGIRQKQDSDEETANDDEETEDTNDDGTTEERSEEEDDADEDEDEDDNGDDEEEEEEEPRLKYATLTKSLSSLYRNGDATSACIVAGDKMIVGTHNGNVHVLHMPSLQPLKVYRAHNASVTSISISPPKPITSGPQTVDGGRLSSLKVETPHGSPQNSPSPKKGSRRPEVPKTPANDIYIATSSIDGHVCIASLIDPEDVQLRNFGRPLHAVSLSPQYKTDKTYLSGGQAGMLVQTIGGQKGKTSNATTTGTTGIGTSWLATIGLGADAGTDQVRHSGEGPISTIKWSLSGKYVLWVNETGIKIMRSHLHHRESDTGHEWKRLSHTDRPDRPIWEEMAPVWKARVEWIDRKQLDIDREQDATAEQSADLKPKRPAHSNTTRDEEEVVIGWGDTVWFLKVNNDSSGSTNSKHESLAGVVHQLGYFPLGDCTISGVSMYATDLLLVLAHMEQKGAKRGAKASIDNKSGRTQKRNGLEPEIRIIDLTKKPREELESDTLAVSRFETLTSSDYHLAVLPPIRHLIMANEKGYLESFGNSMSVVGSGFYTGVETLGQGMLDATMYGPRKLGVSRIFSGNESIRSGHTGTEGSPNVRGSNYLTGWIPGLGSSTIENGDARSVTATTGIKIFVFSPYDCIVGVKRNIADRLQWLLEKKQFESAWELLDSHPEAAGPSTDSSGVVSPPTPSKASSTAISISVSGRSPAPVRQNTLTEFFADSLSIASSQETKNAHSKAKREKRRIGELWLQQLIDRQQWHDAGETAAKVLNTADRWEKWIYTFIQNNKFDEISIHVPTFQIIPPLPSQIFEVILGHYVARDKQKFRDLLDLWPSDLFEISSITSAIEHQLESDSMKPQTEDWRVLQECLAKLCLADGRYQDALKCYIRVQDADTALALIKEHHLAEAVSEDIPKFVLLRIPPEQLETGSEADLMELSSEPIRLLADETTHGTISVQNVAMQLQESGLSSFLFFYFRALWKGEGIQEKKTLALARGRSSAANIGADEGRVLVEQYADTAVELFAEYDRQLLSEFLQGSSIYTYDKAVSICEQRHYVEELVYLLSKTGSVKKALYLIIDELKDVSKAINFAREQDDKGLWDDFLDYSMSRPEFISGLLAEVGTAVDPIELVKRIPSGLEIEGLKEGLQKMLREYDIQDSISSGVAKVITSEVAVGMATLRQGRRAGIKFETSKSKGQKFAGGREAEDVVDGQEATSLQECEPGHCAVCGKAFRPEDSETLIGFACGHVYHVPHLLKGTEREHEREMSLPKLRRQGDEEDSEETSTIFSRSIAAKVTSARLLKDQVDDIGGCRICRSRSISQQTRSN